MKHLAYAIIAIMLLAAHGCSKNEPQTVPAGSLTVDGNRSVIRLNNNNEDSFVFSFDCNYAWHIETSGSGFTVSPASGSAGSYDVTVTAIQPNESDERKTLGNIKIAIDNSEVKYNIRVDQLARAGKTVIAYFFGTSLSYYFNQNLNDMKSAIDGNILGNDRLIVLMQSSQAKATIKEIYYDEAKGSNAEYIFEELTLPEELTADGFGAYVSKMIGLAPADSYGFITLGHSKAWLPTTPVASQLSLRRPSYIPDWTPAEGAEITRNIGERNVLLDINDLAEGLKITNVKFDWLYFDVCFMASAEAAYALHDVTDNVIGSPCEIMGYGSPYNKMLGYMFDNDLTSTCRTYYEFYQNEYTGRKSGCISTIVCSELPNLAAKIREMNAVENRSADFDVMAIQTYEGMDGHIFFDLSDYMRAACSNNALVEEFETQLAKTVINRYHTDGFYSAYNAAMNDISYYSGINTTPDEYCIEVLAAQEASLESEYDAKMEEKTALENELKEEGIDPSSSKEYKALVNAITDLNIRRSAISEQRSTLAYYNPSLKLTDWYAVTH